jgi:hypothetical protein
MKWKMAVGSIVPDLVPPIKPSSGVNPIPIVSQSLAPIPVSLCVVGWSGDVVAGTLVHDNGIS